MLKMRALIWTFLIAAAMGCTERNPEYCGDGTCIDPGKPYCDVDGTFSGTAGTCIAVQCTPDEFAHCRDDIAITCSDNGKNYDSVECPMGCAPAASGCIECTTNAQCGSSAVCDPMTSHCRGCQADDECDSRICDTGMGSCVAESAIVYASPNGTGTCSLSQPCSLSTAYVTAANASPPRTIRMLPGTYTTTLRADVPTATPVKVVATDASIVVVGDVAAVVVDGGASLEIRNLGGASERLVQCGLASTNAPLSRVSLENSTVSTIGIGIAFEVQRCELDLRVVDLTLTMGGDVLGTRNDSTFKADRLYVHGTGAVNNIIGGGARVKLEVTNAVLEDTSVVTFFNDTAPPGSSIRFAYTTFLLRGAQTLCNGPTAMYRTVAYENSIMVSLGAFDAFSTPNPANCSFASTMLTRQATPPSGTTVADPKFVDQGAHNYHLMSGSPAIDAASTSTSDHDIEGTPRPQGAMPDLGAYEYRP